MFESPESILRPYLDADERLLWSGQPAGGFKLRRSDIFAIPFSLMWGGFAIFWELGVLNQSFRHSDGPAKIFPIFGIPFVVMGLYLIFGRFFVDARMRARTYYGLTNQRIIVLSGLVTQQTRTFPLVRLADSSLILTPDGTGTIIFGPNTSAFGAPMAGAWPNNRASRNQFPAFEFIDNAKKVYDLVRSLQKAAV